MAEHVARDAYVVRLARVRVRYESRAAANQGPAVMIPPEPLWQRALAARQADAERASDTPARDRVIYDRERFARMRSDPAALEEYRRKDAEQKRKRTRDGKRPSRAKRP